MAYLTLVRHGQSEWNEKGLWTGLTDVTLTDLGREEAQQCAEALGDIHFDAAFTSTLRRAEETLAIIVHTLGITIPTENDPALNERDYGIYTGKNKWQIKEEVGETEFQEIRRSWDHPIPEGESLKQVYARVVPYYQKNIFPRIALGKNVLVVASGNSLRALIKYLEGIADDAITRVEIKTGEAWVYAIETGGHIVSKEIRAKKLTQTKSM